MVYFNSIDDFLVLAKQKIGKKAEETITKTKASQT